MSDTPTRSEAVRATFDLASSHYDHPLQVQWDVTAEGTLDAAALAHGEDVLDLCCGAGSTAIPAARAVGPDGAVVGVDLSERMLDLARAKQAEAGLHNLRFEQGDITALTQPDASFDVVICQLGLFFVEDMQAALRGMWRIVKPGGRLVVTTFLGRPMQPAGGAFQERLVAETGPAPPVARADETSDPESVTALLMAAGTSRPTVTTRDFQVPLPAPEDFWTFMLGGGMRSAVEALPADVKARIQDGLFTWLRDEGVTELSWNLMFSVAHKS